MMEVVGIRKKFGDLTALSSINLMIEDKQVVGLLGPNGAGKTTLIRVLTGFYTADQGKIKLNGKVVETKSPKYKKIIGYLPENNPLYPSMRVAEYLEFIGKMKIIDEYGVKVEVLEAAKECGLMEVFDKNIDVLSKGYRQRVGLAAAIIGDPEILILDEPTSGLDPKQIVEIRTLIKKLAKKKTVILSTHILPEAKAVCDRLLLINRGKIVLDAKTASVRNLEKKFIELTA